VNTAVCLAGYGVVLGVVAPAWLTRVAGSGRAPRLGIAAWLLAGGTVAGSLLAAAAALIRSGSLALVVAGWVLLLVGGTRVGWAGRATWRGVRHRRAAHRQLVAIVGQPDPRLGVVMVEAAEPLVYCLPAPAATVVVTTAARRALSRGQLRAALTHERAHLAGRHHLLLAVAAAVGRALPWLPVFAQAGAALASLLEMRADDAAARVHGRRTVAAAIAAMGSRPAPVGVLGMAGGSALARGLRLSQDEPAWRARLGQLGLAATVLALSAGPYLAGVLPMCPHPWW
jgi:Zn-dependent protease with chaperone function